MDYYALTHVMCWQLQEDAIFPTKNNNDRDGSLRKKWESAILDGVKAFYEFWTFFLNQCVLCASLASFS